MQELCSHEIEQPMSIQQLVARPELRYLDLDPIDPERPQLNARLSAQIQTRSKYAGYIAKQMTDVERMRAQEQTIIPITVDYASISALSNEAREKLYQVKPETLGMASRIEGVTPSDISILAVHLKAHSRRRKRA